MYIVSYEVCIEVQNTIILSFEKYFNLDIFLFLLFFLHGGYKKFEGFSLHNGVAHLFENVFFTSLAIIQILSRCYLLKLQKLHL